MDRLSRPGLSFAIARAILENSKMLFDVMFFGLPLSIIVILVGLAIRDEDPRFWPPAICLAAYCVYYLFGGREIILYLATAVVGASILF